MCVGDERMTDDRARNDKGETMSELFELGITVVMIIGCYCVFLNLMIMRSISELDDRISAVEKIVTKKEKP